MRTLFTFHYPAERNAGAPGVTYYLGDEYEKLGHQVYYYNLDDTPKSVPPLLRYMLFPGFVSRQIMRSIQCHNIDVIDASTGDAWVWASLLQRFSKKRPLLIARCHGLEHIEHLEYLEESRRGNLKLSWKYPLYRGSIHLWESAMSMRHSDLVLLLNRRDRDFVVEKLGVHPDRTQIIPNGIPESMLNLPFEPTPAENEPIRIAQVSSYIIRKGIQYGSPALSSILKKYPQVEVSFFGTECGAEEVYKDFDPALHDRIKVVPYYANQTLPTLLKGHHIKVLPTISEGFGVALVEAMACGLVPVTTEAPGPLEIVHDGIDGLVVPCRDRDRLEQAIEQLIRDRALLDRLRHNAYAAAQGFSWPKVAQFNLDCYERARSMKR